MTVAFALSAAVLFALGFVLQQRAASRAPADERLSLRLLIDLARRPVWLAGIGAMVGGQLLGAFALASGSLTVVEPLEAANLLFALPMAAGLAHRRVGRQEVGGAVSLIAGLALFVVAAGPAGNQIGHVSDVDWLIGGPATVVGAGVFLVISRLLRAESHQAGALAASAGIIYGLQDALTQRALYVLDHAGLVAMLTTWQGYGVIVAAVVGLVLAQTAFEMAPLAASLPPITAAEPLAGIAIGAGLFAERIQTSGGALAAEASGIALMVAGIFLLGRSPFITGDLAEERAGLER